MLQMECNYPKVAVKETQEKSKKWDVYNAYFAVTKYKTKMQEDPQIGP